MVNASALARVTANFLYPLRCAGCSAFDSLLCAECNAMLEPATGQGRCRHCSARWDGTDFCPRCFYLQEISGARAAFEMSGPARRLVHDLKYRRYKALAALMAGHLRTAGEGLEVNYWFAVPLHRSREKERGFNQSGLLLAEAGLPPGPGQLRRVRKTATQVGQHHTERRRNVSDAFAYRGPSLEGLRIGLVDDVITTGATVNECARVLRAAGAAQVWALAFARASYDPDHAGAITD